ncbi:MAG: hypothetical protein FWH21_00875 [Kiritimatiellaeota bacterium]|nr:hypothetical protein [Kiritimatiellota bacterium]
MSTGYPISYCDRATGKIDGTLSFDEIVGLIIRDPIIKSWTEKARHLKANPPGDENLMTYEDIKQRFLPQILPNAVFDGADKTKAYAKDGSPWCMGEWDKLPCGEDADRLIAGLSVVLFPAIAALTLSGTGVWALFRVDPAEKQAVNGRAVVRHCKSLTAFADYFDASSVRPCQGRTLCWSDVAVIITAPTVIPVSDVDRYVEPAPKRIKSIVDMSPSYRRACVRNTAGRIRKLSEGNRNRGINAACFALHKTIGVAATDEAVEIESACLSIGMTRDELNKITGYRKLRGLA